MVALIEDDAAVRDSIRILLETAGHSVRPYSSGTQFLAKAPLDDLACLVVDQYLPEVNGLDVVARLRCLEADIPAILITAGQRHVLSRRAAELGVVQVLEKPLLDDELLATVTALLG